MPNHSSITITSIKNLIHIILTIGLLSCDFEREGKNEYPKQITLLGYITTDRSNVWVQMNKLEKLELGKESWLKSLKRSRVLKFNRVKKVLAVYTAYYKSRDYFDDSLDLLKIIEDENGNKFYFYQDDFLFEQDDIFYAKKKIASIEQKYLKQLVDLDESIDYIILRIREFDALIVEES